jgi:hypothetical protein
MVMTNNDPPREVQDTQSGWFGITISDRANVVLTAIWWLLFLLMIFLGWVVPALLEARR